MKNDFSEKDIFGKSHKMDTKVDIPHRQRGEKLVDYAEKLAMLYVRISNLSERKLKGQFFTPKQVSAFMVNLFHIQNDTIRLLDPGAGIGILSAAFCERLLHFSDKVTLYIEAYENDPKLLPFLERVLHECRLELRVGGHTLKYNILEEDFILQNAKFLKNNDTLLLWKLEREQFDYVISNPPYYKLDIASPHASAMKQLVLGQPNIYPFFMALSLSMLKTTGEMVFITPRSFCSGKYYSKFRDWFLENADIEHIHIFESRKDIFDHDGVLQENIIIKARPAKKKHSKRTVNITVSKDKFFKDLKEYKISYEDMIHQTHGCVLIKIPTSDIDIHIQHTLKNWNHTLHSLGLEISTGPVVAFRAREYLTNFKNDQLTAPLIWMHNIRGMKVLWPAKKNGKHEGIRIEKESTPLLLPVKNYVLVKRFSSKEQSRRLYAGVLLESEFKYNSVGIENHVNYIYRRYGCLTSEEAFGIAALLNTSIIDTFFRSLNGNTQVNASDIRVLPLPPLEILRKIGRIIETKRWNIGQELDCTITEVLGIKDYIVKTLNRKVGKHGEN